MTGTDFLLQGSGKRQEVREIIACRKRDVTSHFQIAALGDRDFAEVKGAANFWAAGFKRLKLDTERYPAGDAYAIERVVS